jgi:hypothetical protein
MQWESHPSMPSSGWSAYGAGGAAGNTMTQGTTTMASTLSWDTYNKCALLPACCAHAAACALACCACMLARQLEQGARAHV